VGPAASDSCDALDNDCDGFTDTAACLRLSAADVRLDRGATAGASNSAFPTAAAAGATSVTTAYLDLRNGNADIFGITSADSGATWPAADGRIDQSGVARPSVGPRMTAVGSNVFLAWEDFRDAATYRNIYFRRSTNAGASWAGSDLRLDTGLNTDSFNVSIAADAGGGVYVAWETMGNDRARHVYVARSTDSGATFGAPVRVDHNAISTPVAVCSEPQLAVNGAGTVYLAWRDNRNGKADIYFNRSTDRGATWVAADARLDTDPTSPGAFSTVPRVAATAAGRVVVVWQDDRTVGLDNALKVYANVSSDAGVTWRSADVRLDNPPGPADSFSPRLAVDPSTGRFVAVYQDGRNGLSDLYVRTSLDGVSWTAEARADADVAGFGSSANAAVVAAGGRAYVAWEEIRIDGGRRDIHFNYSFDGGLAFQPADLRFDAGTAGQYDSHDPVAVLQSGRLHVFWVDHRSGTGANGDIYTRYAY
jgi:hypothetical protein